MSPNTRDKIVDAAQAVVREQGVAKLTLDAAAKQAQMSKGGVLYHFNSKDDLIRAMVQRLIEACEAVKEEYYAAEPAGPYRHTRAVIRLTFDPRGPAADPVGSALLAAISINPALMEPFYSKFRQWQEEVASDSPNPALASMICLAMDGYMFDRMLKLPFYDTTLIERIKQTALDLLK